MTEYPVYILRFLLLMLVSFSSYAVEPPSKLCLKNADHKHCIEPETTADANSNVVTDGVVKWNPGHYAMGHNLKKALNYPNIVGVKKRYFWRDLEPSKGIYDFSSIEKDLQYYSQYNKQFFIVISYKAFHNNADKRLCAPEYIWEMGGIATKLYSETQNLTHRGDDLFECFARIYMEPVADSFIALLHALGKRFDHEPHIEGIQLPETASACAGCNYKDIADDHKNAIKRVGSEASDAFPTSTTLYMTNYIPEGEVEMKKIMGHLYQVGAGTGGPDLTPYNHNHATVFNKEFAGKMPLAIDNQRALKVGRSPMDAYNWAVLDGNGLYVNYLFWATHNPSPWDFDNDIIPLLKQNDWKIHKACPENKNCASE